MRAQVADLSTETLLDYFDFMAAGDEEVNRSANPRFPLETVLVRLATLPKTLPIAHLLERLEKLERKLPGAAADRFDVGADGGDANPSGRCFSCASSGFSRWR